MKKPAAKTSQAHPPLGVRFIPVYPDVSLKDARDRRDASRKLLADGIDPSENRKAMKSARACGARSNGRAYNRTAHLPERRKMMQQWADYLDKLKGGTEVIPLHGQFDGLAAGPQTMRDHAERSLAA